MASPISPTSVSNCGVPSGGNTGASARCTDQHYSLTLRGQDLKLHVRTFLPKGTPKKEPYVLVHGFQANRATYTLLAAELQRQGHAVYVIDLPGHGKSDRPSWFHYDDPDDYLQTLQAFLKQAQLKQVHLVGHSMGSGLSLYCALKHPESVSRLTLLSPWYQAIPVSQLATSLPDLADEFLGSTNPFVLNRVLRNVSRKKTWTHHPDIVPELAAQIDIENPEVSYGKLLGDTARMKWDKLKAAMTPAAIAHLKQKVSVRIIYGSDETLIPQHQIRALAKRLGVSITKVEGVGHQTSLEAPVELAAVILSEERPPKTIVYQGPQIPDEYLESDFQIGARALFEVDPIARYSRLRTQLFINWDRDYPGHLQWGAEVGGQFSKDPRTIAWDAAAYARSKFYWMRFSEFELFSAASLMLGARQFDGKPTQPLVSVDMSPLIGSVNVFNNGYILDILLGTRLNLISSDLKSDSLQPIGEEIAVQTGLELKL